ncbi:MAG: nicotinate-nucleotide adenylyltransferase [Desulfurivibrio sp.]|nr:nicotinate-nucleotide adenylyltransferase [Desulfurivibrio sp.]
MIDFDLPAGSRLGILGGTFDPVHNGHLVLARAARDHFALDRVVLIPAAQPPHKQGEPVSPFARRAAMLEMALDEQPGLFYSRMEQQRPGPSYSIDTLRQLRQELPAACALFFIIGSDAFAEITSWQNYQQLFQYADFLVAQRPESAPQRLADTLAGLADFLPPAAEPAAAASSQHPVTSNPQLRPWRHRQGGLIYPCPVAAVPVSSSEIRRRVRQGEPIAHLVPPPVADYIARHRLYKSS